MGYMVVVEEVYIHQLALETLQQPSPWMNEMSLEVGDINLHDALWNCRSHISLQFDALNLLVGLVQTVSPVMFTQLTIIYPLRVQKSCLCLMHCSTRVRRVKLLCVHYHVRY